MFPLAAIPLAVSAIQTGIGAAQSISGAKKRRNIIRPEYAIPDEVRKNLNIAEQEATYGLDAASKNIATQGIDRGTAAGLYGAGTRKAGLAGLGSVVQANNDAFANLAAMDAMAIERKKQNAMAARSEMAGYKDKAFEINKMQPYQMSMDESQALIGSGLQNVMGGLNTAATTGLYGGFGGGNDGGNSDASQRSVSGTTIDSTNNITNAMNQKNWWMSLSPQEQRRLTAIGKLKIGS